MVPHPPSWWRRLPPENPASRFRGGPPEKEKKDGGGALAFLVFHPLGESGHIHAAGAGAIAAPASPSARGHLQQHAERCLIAHHARRRCRQAGEISPLFVLAAVDVASRRLRRYAAAGVRRDFLSSLNCPPFLVPQSCGPRLTVERSCRPTERVDSVLGADPLSCLGRAAPISQACALTWDSLWRQPRSR